MAEELKSLYQTYSKNGGIGTLEEFEQAKVELGDENFNSFVSDFVPDLKKKDNPNPIAETPLIAPPISQDLEGSPMYQQEQDSLALASTEQPTSTELPLTPTVSSGLENSNTTLPKVTEPALTNVGEKVTPISTLDVLAGKSNNIQGGITPTPSTQSELDDDTLKNDNEAELLKSESDTQSKEFLNQYLNKDYVNAKIPNVDKGIEYTAFTKTKEDINKSNNNIRLAEQSGDVEVSYKADGTENTDELGNIKYKILTDSYKDKFNAYISEINTSAGNKNIDSARFNLGNAGNIPEITPDQEYISELNKYGVLLDISDYEKVTNEADRNKFVASAAAAFNAQKNGTTFQAEYDKEISKYALTDEVKIANGFEASNLLLGNSKWDVVKDKAEIDLFENYFKDKNNVLDFGEYWNNEGKAKFGSSTIQEMQSKEQTVRATIWNDYLSYKNDKLNTNITFTDTAVEQANNRLKKFVENGDIVSAQKEEDKINGFINQYNQNEEQKKQLSGFAIESNQAFTQYNKQKEQEAEFQRKVDEGKLGANTQNILGQVVLGIESSVKSAVGGVARFVSVPFGDGNVKDAVDIFSDKELQIGNVKIAPLSQKVVEFKGADGLNYKEVNGTTYQSNNGELLKTNYQRKESDKVTKEDTEYNWSGLTFMASKAFADIYITRGIEGGINKAIVSIADRIATSKKIASVFGEASQIAKVSANFARLPRNASGASVKGWTVQMFNDSYQAGEKGGIKGDVNKFLYALTIAGVQSQLQRINPDINFIKSINNETQQIVKALMANETKTALGLLKSLGSTGINATKKIVNNTGKELPEEFSQQGFQDVVNLFVNKTSGTNLEVTDKQGYKDLAFGTVGTSVILSLVGGGSSNMATINNKQINLAEYSRNDLATEIARDPNGKDILKNFKNTAYFQSQKDSAQDIINEINERAKYISKVPESDKYSTTALSEVSPILQKIDEKKELLKNDDGTFSGRINNDIAVLTEQANAILDNDLNTNNAENPQSTPQSEGVQNETSKTTIDLNAKTGDTLYQTEYTNLNTEENGSSAFQKPIANQEMQTDGQSVQEEGGNPNVELREVPKGNQESEQVTQASTQEQTQINSNETQEQTTLEQTNPSAPTQFGSETDANITDNQVAENQTTQNQEVNEDDIVLADDTLDLINSLTDETAQSDNTTTDGSIQLPTNVVQQQGENNDTEKTDESTRSEGKVEVNNFDYVTNELINGMSIDELESLNLKMDDANYGGNMDWEIQKRISELEKNKVLFATTLEDAKKELKKLDKKNDEMPNGYTSSFESSDINKALNLIDEYDNYDIGVNVAKKRFIEGLNNEGDTLYNLSGAIKFKLNLQYLLDNGFSLESLMKDYAKEFYQYDESQVAGVIKRKVEKFFGNTTVETVEERKSLSQKVTPTETQATVLTEAERGRNNLVGMKTAYNKLSKAKKNQEDGKIMFARINQLSKKLGYPIGSMGDGKISIKNPKTGKEMAKVKETFSEKIPTKKEVATAKKHLEDVAVWDGNTFNDHWESDLTWAEIRRGKEDIDNGKLSTVPARRLVNEINRQINDYGGFNFTKGAGQITDKTLISLQEIEDSKQAFPKVWSSLDLLTTQELENLYNERAESEADFYKNRTLQDENNSVYEERQSIPSESSGNDSGKTELNSPEYKSLVTQRDSAEKEVASKKAKLDSVSKNTNKDFQADQENLFEERPTQEGLFDERADGNAGKEVISNAKREYDQAKAELSRLNNAIRDFESGKVTGTEALDLQSTDKQFTPITQKAYNALVKKLSGVFKKFGANVVTDLSEFKAKAKALGLNASEIDLMIRAFHGSPYSFDRFTTEKMGTGEGAQHFGWGLYFTDIKGIAEGYAKQLASNKIKEINRQGDEMPKNAYDALKEVDFFGYENEWEAAGVFLKGKSKESFIEDYDITSEEYDAIDKSLNENNRNLYEVSLHKGKTPEQYTWLEWDKNITTEFNDRIRKQAKKEGLLTERTGKSDVISGVVPTGAHFITEGVNGNEIYDSLEKTFGSSKEASLFLLRAGIDGVKYPAESISRGATSDNARGFNYVVFDENAITIDNKVEFMKTNGEIYGAKLPDGTIYLNPDKVNANTPIHEFSHLWQQLMPTRFKSGVEILKNTPVGKKTFAELKANEGYANKTDEEIWNEALVTVIGNEGERIFNSPKTSKIKTWLTDFFKKLGDVLGIRKLTPTDNLSVFVKGALSEVMGDKEIFAENGLNGSGNIDFQIPKFAKPTNLMPKSLIANITNAIRNGGNFNDAMNVAKESNWYKNLGESAKNNFDLNALKQTVVDSSNYYKESAEIKVAETKEKTKAKIETIKSENKDKILKLKDKYKERIEALKGENKELRVKQAERKAIVKETVYQLKSLLVGNNLDGRVTPTEISRLIKLASDIGASSKPATALNTFFEEYAKIQEKAEARLEVAKNKELTRDEYEQLKTIVQDMVDGGIGIDAIKDSVRALNLPFSKANFISKEVLLKINEIVSRYQTDKLTPEQSAELLATAYNQSKDGKNENADERTKLKKSSDYLKTGFVNFVEKYSDRQFKAKEALRKIGALNTYNRLINSAGSSAKANETHSKIYEKVFKGLDNDARVKLNQIIVARRIIAIEENREKRGLSPINHTNNITYDSAKKALQQFETENKTQYDDLLARSKDYFKAFNEQLDAMLKGGLITQQAYDGMNGIDYQPRMFLQHISDYQGNVEEGIGGANYNTSKKAVGSSIIQTLDEGSIGKMVMDADWILRVAIASNTKMSAMNEVNMVFITKELPKARADYDLLKQIDESKRTPEQKQFIRYFENLSEQVKDNPIVGYTAQGNPKFKIETPPQGFTKNYYYIDGVRNEFFLSDDLHNNWNDIYEKNITKSIEGNVVSKVVLTYPTKFTKLMATGINPLFFIVNTPRDFFQVINFSDAYSDNVLKATKDLALDTFKAYKDTYNKDRGAENTMYEKYIEYGGGMDFLATQGKFDKKYADKNKILGALDTINTLSKYSEIGFRIATFSRSNQNGLKEYNKENNTNYKSVEEIPNQYDKDNIYHNSVRTARAVMDFNQGGKTTKDLDSMLPYLNASVQGTRSMVDSLRKRPYQTAGKMAQTATYMTGLVFGLMASAFSLFDDDDDEKSSIEKILDAYDRITPTQRANSWNIVLPNSIAEKLGFVLPEKKAIGEYYVLKIAKTQALAPLLYVMEEGFLNIAKASLGRQERSYFDIGKASTDIANKNLLPFELAYPTAMFKSLIGKTFAGKAFIANEYGYDTYRGEKLSADIDQVPIGAEGLANPNVEDFYKDFGKVSGYSPVRTKAMVEGLITSPQTNPYVMATYGTLNVATNLMSKEDRQIVSGRMKDDIKRMATGRLFSQTSQYAKSLSTSTKANKDKFEEVDYAYAKRNAMVKELSTGIANGTVTVKYAEDKVLELKLTENETKNMFDKISERIENKDVDPELFSIKYDKSSAEGKALRLVEAYPTIDLRTTTKEANSINAQLDKIGGIATKDVISYYVKIMAERDKLNK